MALGLRARSVKARLVPFVGRHWNLLDAVVRRGLVLDGDLTAGALLVFVLYLGKMHKPMKGLSKMADTISKAAVGFERVASILAHRLATVRRADIIFVLHDGVISERGPHGELPARNGLYARLYRMQFRHEGSRLWSFDDGPICAGPFRHAR